MTAQMKRRLDGSVVPYAAMSILDNEEYVASLKEDKENADAAFRKSQQVHAYCGRDSLGRLWLNGKKRAPTREELIEGWMAYQIHTPTKNARGWSVMGEGHWPTREEAESKVDRLYPDLKPAAAP